MPLDENLLHSFAVLLTERAMDDYGLRDPEPSSLAQFIAEVAQIDQNQADALAWGEPAELDSEQLDRLSDVFALHRDMLSCFLRPTSSEMVLHVLNQTADLELDGEQCPLCAELAEQVLALQSSDDSMLSVCLEMIGHLTIERGSGLDFEAETLSLLPQLDLVLAALTSEAQQRVLAYAYQELAETTDGLRAARFSQYAKLRTKYLSPLARSVLDLLASTESGGLSASQIVHRLGRKNARALGQLPRSLSRSMEKMQRAGFEINETPLTVSGSAGAVVFSLSDNAQSSWRALVQADPSLTRQGN